MKRLFAASWLFLFTGCATIIDGRTQTIMVNTNPPKADCILERMNNPAGEIPSTPGSAVIEKTRDNIKIVCSKSGYENATYIDNSGTDGWVFGNIALGGLIGAGVDWATGAIHKYDSPVNISLVSAHGDDTYNGDDAPKEKRHKHHRHNDDYDNVNDNDK